MRRGMVLEDLRVQEIPRAGGGFSYTVLWPDGTVDEEADAYAPNPSVSRSSWAGLSVDRS